MLKNILLFSLIACFWACEMSVEEPNFRKTDMPYILCFISPTDTVYSATFNHFRRDFGQNEDIDAYNDKFQKVKVFLTDGIDTLELKNKENDKNVFSVKPAKLKVQRAGRYTLLIKMEDGNIANAVCEVPNKDVDYNSIQFIDQKPLNEFWNQIKMKAYILRWDDPNPEKRNYYALHYTSVIRNKNTGKIENNNGFYPSNVYGIEEGGSGKVITNVLQDFVLKSDYFGGKEVLNSIHCLNTDIHFYKYHKNLLALPLEPTPFEEPKDFYSNFNGNIKGTFGAYTNTSFYK